VKRIVVALFVGACSSAPPPATPTNVVAAPPELIAIDDLPRLEGDRGPQPAGVERDCRLGVVLRKRFGNEEVRPCGALGKRPDLEVIENARICVLQALMRREQFVLEEKLRGIDSAVENGLVGVQEHDKISIYLLRFDGDPCGGSCSEDGGTRIERCDHITFDVESCGRSAVRCFQCEHETEIESCKFGRRSSMHALTCAGCTDASS
jgi:hypothetical protein